MERLSRAAFLLRSVVGLASLGVGTMIWVQACATSGSGTARFEQPLPTGGVARARVEVKWGPPEPQPQGARFTCPITIGGREVEVWEDSGPPRRQWLREPGTTEWNPLIGAEIKCASVRGAGGTMATRGAGSRIVDVPAIFAVNETATIAVLSVELPGTIQLIDPARPAPGEASIDVGYAAVPTSNGWRVRVEGSLNEVAKWGLYQGLQSFEIVLPGFGAVSVTLDGEYSAIVLRNGRGALLAEEHDPIRFITWGQYE